MVARSPLLLLAVSVASCAPALRPPSEAPESSRLAEAKPMTFEAAVKDLVEKLEAAAPEGIRVKVRETTPRVLGWKAPESSPARILELWAPSGVNSQYGLLPGRGRLEHAGDLQAAGPEERGGTPRLVAVGPGLVVVDAPTPMVALTLEVERRDGPLLHQTASGTIFRWSEGEPLEGDARPVGLAEAHRVIRHAHWLEIELAPEATFDPGPLLASGETALSFREAPPVDGGLLPVPTLLFATP